MEAAHPIWRPIGQLLVDKGLLTQEELEDVLEEQSTSGRRLGEIIVERRLVSGPQLTAALAEQWGLVLTTEGGFGTGLRAQIDARHSAARGLAPSVDAEPELETDAEPEPDAEIALDTVADVIEALEEAQPEPPPTPVEDAGEDDRPVEAQIVHLPAPAQLHLLFIPTPAGYRLAAAAGPAPAVGTVTMAGTVTRLGRSPLPDDARVCAYLLPG